MPTAESVIHCAEEFVCFVIEQPMPDVRVVRVSGELDLLTTPLLEIRLQQCIEKRVGHLVVDLGGVTFLGAAGLTSLVAARKAATGLGVQLHLSGTDHRAVARPLDITMLRPSFDIHPTADAVVAVVSSRKAS
ncbi:MAG: STAS domain-containing protein [Pseudonocardiaceae bacterium]